MKKPPEPRPRPLTCATSVEMEKAMLPLYSWMIVRMESSSVHGNSINVNMHICIISEDVYMYMCLEIKLGRQGLDECYESNDIK